jgi:hypothetical protein
VISVVAALVFCCRPSCALPIAHRVTILFYYCLIAGSVPVFTPFSSRTTSRPGRESSEQGFPSRLEYFLPARRYLGSLVDFGCCVSCNLRVGAEASPALWSARSAGFVSVSVVLQLHPLNSILWSNQNLMCLFISVGVTRYCS